MISVLVPTRGRVAEFTRMVQSIKATAQGDVEVLGYVDDDDPARTEYLKIDGATFKVGKRIVLTQCWNELLPLAHGDIFCQGNDDIVFRTLGWDVMVEREFANSGDKILMVHGDDAGCQHDRFGPHPFVHRRWIDRVGYFIPPYFSSDYGDTWINEIANELGRRKYLAFVVEHMHFLFEKASRDITTEERLKRGERDRVDVLYEQLRPERLRDIQKLRDAMNPLKWQIMILTQPSRSEYLKRLLSVLMPQVEPHHDVEVMIGMFNPMLTLGENRSRMSQKSYAQYINFMDDDDLPSKRYVEEILPLLDGVDYIGFRVQCFIDDRPFSKTYHSLKYSGWYNDDAGYYRDISHINPMRRDLAVAAGMAGGFGEDSRWAEAMRALGIVKTEHYVDDVMYFYYSRPQKNDAAFRYNGEDVQYQRGIWRLSDALREYIPSQVVALRLAAAVQPKRFEAPVQMYPPCPSCLSTCTCPSNGMMRCNQCGSQFTLTKIGRE